MNEILLKIRKLAEVMVLRAAIKNPDSEIIELYFKENK